RRPRHRRSEPADGRDLSRDGFADAVRHRVGAAARRRRGRGLGRDRLRHRARCHDRLRCRLRPRAGGSVGHNRGVSIGSPFHPRTAPLNRKQQWREWSGYWASSAYADAHDIEYNAIREAAALIDVSPLYKYKVGGRDALALVDRVITRDASKLAVGQVWYTPWCDEHGKVID